MKKLQLILAFITFSIILALPLHAASDYINSPRIIRVGLEIMSHAKKIKMTSSNGVFEVFNINTKKTIFNGKASDMTLVAKKGGLISLEINGKTIVSNNSISVTNTFGPRNSNNTITVDPYHRKPITYRGSFEVTCFGSELYLVNIVDIEDYLRSVVPSEISTRAPKAAQQAQAIAARTYAIRNLYRHSKKDDYNICDTVHCQAYFGIGKEHESANQAIKATEGQILIYDDSPANTVYHSNCGGYIISSQAAWGGRAVPYLIGHFDGLKGHKTFCEYGKDFLSRNPTLTLPTKSKKLIIGKIGDHSKKKLHSNFGHRVGMCQDGAIGMAAIGYSCGNILGFYYPKTKIVTLKYAKQKNNASFAPTKVITVAQAKAKESEKAENKLPKPILPVEIPATTVPASATSQLAKADSDKTIKADNASDTADIEENTVDDLEIEKEALNSVKDVIKEISEVKPNSTSEAIRKVYWRSLGPRPLVEKNKPQNNRRDRRRRRR